MLCKVSFKNDPIDRRVILYLKDCDCGRKYCQENAAYLVKNHLRRVKLKDIAVDFIIEYVQSHNHSAFWGSIPPPPNILFVEKGIYIYMITDELE